MRFLVGSHEPQNAFDGPWRRLSEIGIRAVLHGREDALLHDQQVLCDLLRRPGLWRGRERALLGRETVESSEEIGAGVIESDEGGGKRYGA